MSDNVADHYYRRSRRREKQTGSRDVYGHTLSQNYPETGTDLEKEKEKERNRNQETYVKTQN